MVPRHGNRVGLPFFSGGVDGFAFSFRPSLIYFSLFDNVAYILAPFGHYILVWSACMSSDLFLSRHFSTTRPFSGTCRTSCEVFWRRRFVDNCMLVSVVQLVFCLHHDHYRLLLAQHTLVSVLTVEPLVKGSRGGSSTSTLGNTGGGYGLRRGLLPEKKLSAICPNMTLNQHIVTKHFIWGTVEAWLPLPPP